MKHFLYLSTPCQNWAICSKVCGINFAKTLSCTTLLCICHQMNILASGYPRFLLTWYFLSLKGWWNFPWLCQVLAVPGLLPCGLPSYARRWAICTTLCGIDLWKMLSCTSLIQYGSPEEYFGLDYSPCFSWICLINKSQLWVTLSVLY